MSRKVTLFAALSYVFVLSTSVCSAQGFQIDAGAISGAGQSTIETTAQRMRMYVDITGRGQDVKKAVFALKDRMEVAKTTVASQGAVAESIAFGDPKVDAAMSAAHDQLRNQILQGLNRAGRNADDSQTDSLVTVSARMTADWDFSGLDSTDALAKSYELQQKLRDAKLSGKDDTNNLPAEARELLEEAMMMGEEYGEQDTGDPLFVFLAEITETQKKTALKEAYEKARAQAASLAEVAGAKLGKLRTLRETSSSDSDTGYGYDAYEYGSSSYQALQLVNQVQASTESPLAAGIAPGTLKFRVAVHVAYDAAD